MRKVQIITDSCSDLTPELMEKYGVDYAEMNTVYNGEHSPAKLSWTYEEVHKLYGIMRDGNRVTTTQVPVEEFDRVFRKYLDNGCDIVYIGCSLKQSGSVNTAKVLAAELLKEYKDAQISCIDSLHASMGEGILALKAAEYAATGKNVDEITAYVEEQRKYLNQFVTVHTLDFLRKAGRVKASSAFFGNLLGVKPIIIADADGEQAAIKKVKGRANSLKEIVTLLKDCITDPEDQTVYVAHSDCSKEEIEYVIQMIKDEIKCKDVYVGYIGPIIGASIGPDAVALFGFGKQITYRIADKK
ncbi:MAG: DegV family protein [Clostridia bacterium]|nr:DegV family protein [Clostridia bacterium]